MQVSHFPSGALVGKLSPNPIVAIAAGVASHFVIDKIPHYWPATTRGKWVFTIIDYAIAIVMIALLFSLSDGSRVNMFWGFAGSAAVDVLLVGVPFFRKSAFGQWHTKRQPHRTALPSLLSDVALSTVCCVLLLVL